MSVDLNVLLGDYRKSEPRRSSGGINALSGFAYQIRVYIAQLALSLSNADENSSINSSEFPSIETLSDIARMDSNLTLIQVKKTLTKSTLLNAISEIRSILEFIRGSYPEYESGLRFRIIARSVSLPINWNRIVDATLGDGFSSRHMDEPCTHSDPVWDIVANTFNQLTNPYEFVHYAIDRTLKISNTAESISLIRDDICEYYFKHRRDSYFSGRCLSEKDFVDNGSSVGGIDIGKSVTISRLRSRQYMYREARIKNILKNLHKFCARLIDESSNIGVFWLGGKSGAGKSVLLLQLSQILVEGGNRVLWLGGDTFELERAIRELILFPELPRPDFIVVDDLYDRNARETIDLAGISNFIDQSSVGSFPTIITCGPTEFSDSFEEDSCYRGFLIHREVVDLVSAEESKDFIEWFRTRTGAIPQQGRAFEQCHGRDGGLFISLAMECGHGDLRQFSKRFSDRVELNGLKPALAIPLALNRLYLNAPISWLTNHEQEKLQTLNSDGDFNILELTRATESIRISHPHIGNALYLACRKPGNQLSYTNDLVAAFGRSIRENRMGLAVQLLRLFSLSKEEKQREQLNIIDNSLLAKKCAEIWAMERSSVSEPNDHLRIVAIWACWIDEKSTISTVLQEDLIDRVLAVLGNASKYWAMCFDWLSTSHGNSKEILDKISLFLCNEDYHNKSGWSYVWQKTFAGYAENPGKNIMVAGYKWLLTNSASTSWTYIWRLSLTASIKNKNIPRVQELLEIGLEWLQVNKTQSGWAYIWQDLTEYYKLNNNTNETFTFLLSFGVSWIEKYGYCNGGVFIFQDLCLKYREFLSTPKLNGLTRASLSWLQSSQDNQDWPYIWETLITYGENTETNPDFRLLVSLGEKWQCEQEDNGGSWAYVTQKLLNLSRNWIGLEGRQRLASYTLNWLTINQESEQWPYLFQALIGSSTNLGDTDLTDKCISHGLSWLTSNKQRLEWTEIWISSLDYSIFVSRGDWKEKLLSLGISWTLLNHSHKRWPFACSKLIRYKNHPLIRNKVGVLLSVSDDWLRVNLDAAEWPRLMQDLHKLSQEFDPLLGNGVIGLGQQWILAHKCAGEWSYIYEYLLSNEGTHENKLNLVTTGIEWLNDQSENIQWTHVWRCILKFPESLSFHQELYSLGTRWLEGNEDKSDWSFIWQELINNFPEKPKSELNGLIDTGLLWIDGKEGRNEWSYNLKFLINKLSHLNREADFNHILSIAEDWVGENQSDTNWREISLMLILFSRSNEVVTESSCAIENQIYELPNRRDWYRLGHLFRKIETRYGNKSVSVSKLITAHHKRRDSVIWTEAAKKKKSNTPIQGVVLSRKGEVLFVKLELGLIARMYDISENHLLEINSKHDFVIQELNKEKDKVRVVLESEFRFLTSQISKGDICHGVVTGGTTYGLFVKIHGAVGLLHRSKCRDFIKLKNNHQYGCGIDVEILDIKDGKLVLGEVR